MWSSQRDGLQVEQETRDHDHGGAVLAQENDEQNQGLKRISERYESIYARICETDEGALYVFLRSVNYSASADPIFQQLTGVICIINKCKSEKPFNWKYV